MALISAAVQDGVTNRTEIWHAVRQGGGPLCDARLAGVIKKTSKGLPNCAKCKRCDQFGNLDYRKRAQLVLIAKGAVAVPYGTIGQYDDLFEYDLVYWDNKKTRYVLTERGELCVQEALDPAGFVDTHRLFHARSPGHEFTLCGIHVIDRAQPYVEALKALRDAAKKHKSNVVTCVRCAASYGYWRPDR